MAEKLEIVGSVKLDTSGAEAPVKSLKAQLKEANNELIATIDKFGELSPQAAAAAQKVGQLKDKIGDAKTLTDAFNPDAKFKGLSNAIQGATGALTAITGAQALFGSESKAVQETLVKVQGAMAFSQGINSVLESKDAFKALYAQIASVFTVKQADVAVTTEQAVATEVQTASTTKLTIAQRVAAVVQKAWNAAMAANPIATITIAITALIGGIIALVSWLRSSSAENKKNEEQVKQLGRALDNNARSYSRNSDELQRSQSHQLALAKAQGASAAELRKLELKLADEKIATERSARAKALLTIELQKNTLAALKNSGATDEVIKAQEENVKKSIEQANQITANLDKAKIERVEIERRQQVEIAQAETDGRKRREESSRAAADKKKQEEENDRKQREAADKASEENILKINQELEVAKLKDSDDAAKKKLQQDYDNAVKSVEQSKASEEQKKKELEAIKKKYEFDLTKLEETENQKRLEAQKKYDQQRLKIAEELANDLNQVELNRIKDATERRDKELEINRQNEIKANQKRFASNEITLTEYLVKQSLIREKYRLQEEKNNEADAKTNQDNLKKEFENRAKELADEIANNDLLYQVKKQAVDDELELLKLAKDAKILTDEEYTKAEEKNAAKRKAIKKAELDAQLDYAKQFAGILTGLADVLGRNTKAGKKAAIAGLLIDQGLNVAKITMDTIASTKSIAKKYSGIPGGQIPAAIEIGLNIAQGALSVAKSVQAVQKGIADINKAGGGGGEGGAGGGGGADMGTGAPIAPQAQQTALPQEQINQLASANAATRSYVLESDISTNQERITRINRAARIS